MSQIMLRKVFFPDESFCFYLFFLLWIWVWWWNRAFILAFIFKYVLSFITWLLFFYPYSKDSSTHLSFYRLLFHHLGNCFLRYETLKIYNQVVIASVYLWVNVKVIKSIDWIGSIVKNQKEVSLICCGIGRNPVPIPVMTEKIFSFVL